MKTGMVTNQCLPYSLTDYQMDLVFKILHPLMCSSTCRDNSPLNPANTKLVDYGYFYGEDIDDNTIMNQLQSGPVVVSMTVKDPFFDYECGIYCHEVVHTASECEDVGNVHSVELLTMGPLI